MLRNWSLVERAKARAHWPWPSGKKSLKPFKGQAQYFPMPEEARRAPVVTFLCTKQYQYQAQKFLPELNPSSKLQAK